MVLVSEPICRMCKKAPGQMVDHIIPILDKGCKLCLDNLQTLCNSCHSYKSVVEFKLHRPYWMPTPIVPVTIVFGASGSGKTTYCEENMNDGDLLIDLDYIRSDITGKEMYQWDGAEKLNESLLKRNSLLASLARPGADKKYKRVWFILSSPKIEVQQWWSNRLKAKTILMKTTIGVCKERVKSDRRREGKEEYFTNLIDLWFSTYKDLNLHISIPKEVGGSSSLKGSNRGSALHLFFPDKPFSRGT